MMKNYRTILAVLVLCGMCFAQAPSNNDAAIQHLEDQIKALQSEVEAMKTVNQNTALSLQQTQKDLKTTVEGKLSGFARGNVKFGATFFGDFAAYPNGAYAPSFLDNQASLPGPGTSDNNAFDVRRGYLNIIYTPSDRILLRITPDISLNSDGSKYFRLKYGYVDVKHIFGHNGAFGDTTLRAGQGHMPLIDWQEGFYGMRYVYKTPWDYLGLSSTFVGAALKGPIKFNGKEYLDYHVGIYNVAGYHGIEVNAEKQAMGRLTFYPFGTKKDRHGLGITIFDGYGYSASASNAKAQNRGTAMIHYMSPTGKYRASFAYDFGRNAISLKQVTGGSAAATAAYNGVDTANFNGQSWMQSFDVSGSAGLGNTPFTLFGIWQYVQPDTNVSSNPLDYQRIVGGVEYKVNKHFRMALTSENYIHTRGSDLANAITASGGGNASAASENLNAAMLNVEYNY